MAVANEQGCGCGEKHDGCAACGMENLLSYWCDTCKRGVPDKRCPHCGLKSRRKKD
ncbi:hypothetical protein [Geomonas sp.]|uniref:hypothetical protein n=1 Tax=Geomonas sp. TaxID=2651584 RepID=UPI002B4A2AE2|nr:hypothetical protein [Geomonas sp.]HJV34101.1 hypothetical protein [Geomonas sp.]